MSKKKLPQDVLDDLARSGLDSTDAQHLAITPVDAAWCEENLNVPYAGYKIPYWSLDGKPLDFYRVRFLTNPTPTGGKFGTPVNPPIKYSQPADTRPYVYFAPTTALGWRAISQNPELPLVITEGEKKAAAACKHGLTCIGLGGVWSFQSAQRAWALLPELEDFQWEGRNVEICFDSDVMTKLEVHQALTRLTQRLLERKAKVSLVYITPPAGVDKQGLDDLIVASGADAYHTLERHSSELANAIATLNNRACYIAKHGAFWDFEKRVAMDERHARLTLSPLASITEVVQGNGKNASPKIKTGPAFDKWYIHPARAEADDLTYAPGIRASITPSRQINLWVAPEISPRRAAVGQWLDFLRWLMVKPEQFDWFLQWLAYPVQHPGAKLLQAVFVHSPAQGVGKTFAVDPVMRFIYGDDNIVKLSNEQLHSSFNDAATRKQFAIFDEVYIDNARERRDVMGKVKDMVTREKVTVNAKYQRPYDLFDTTNYYITSNHADALALEDDDRRFFVVAAPNAKLPRTDYAELDQWLRDPADPLKPGAGAAAILYHLMHKVDTAAFDPKGPAMRTEAREVTVAASLSHVQEFARRLHDDPEGVLGTQHRCDLYEPQELKYSFRVAYPGAPEPTVNALGRALAATAIPRRECRLNSTSPKKTLYAIFERDRWGKATATDWARHHATDPSVSPVRNASGGRS